jgi:hypothetical protein
LREVVCFLRRFHALLSGAKPLQRTGCIVIGGVNVLFQRLKVQVSL